MVNFKIIIFSIVIIYNNCISQVEINSFEDIEYAIYKGKNKKGTIFLIEGSLPSPSFLYQRGNIEYFGPRNILDLTKEFNLIILGKPDIPIVSKLSEIDSDYLFKDTITGKTPLDFLLNDNLDYYKLKYSKLISKVSKLYNLKNVFVFGHSQGARIALELAISNKRIKGLIYASADPLGRIATVIDKDYLIPSMKEKVNYYSDVIKSGKNDPDSLVMNSTFLSWQSFSFPSIINLHKIKKPTLILFGSNDLSCPNCYVFNILPTFNECIKTVTFENCDHNFKDLNGNNNWPNVISEISQFIH